MLGLDSIKLVTSLDCINSINDNVFQSDVSNLSGEVIKHKKVLNSQRLKEFGFEMLGLKNISVDYLKGELLMEVSAKALKHKYPEQINLNTVEQEFNNIKGYNVIDFNTPVLIDNANVLTCDCTNDLKLTRDVSKVIKDLEVFRFNQKYDCTTYPDKKNSYEESIVFDKNVKSKASKERLTIYSKYIDVTRDNKSNRELLKYVDPEVFTNKARFESRHTSFEQMRKHFNIIDLSLVNVLNSQEQVNAKIFDKITNIENINFENLQNYKRFFIMSQEMQMSNLVKLAGELAIVIACNYNVDLINSIIKNSKTTNKTYARKRFESIMKNIDIAGRELEIDKSINEIKSLLRAA